jgi:tetratricopeptide (TPR) repeat protein
VGRSTTARERFQELSMTKEREESRSNAAVMAYKCLTEEGDCLRHLGRLDEAAAKCEECIRLDTAREALRDVAVGRSLLGTVRLRQRRYAEALAEYRASREVTESLGESTAAEWHQIGIVYQKSRQWDEAESAYLKSLAQKVSSNDQRGEASTRDQLGLLYRKLPGRTEQAVEFHREAAEIHRQLGLRLEEGCSHNNAVLALLDGSRSPELWQNPSLDYADAVELKLLLEQSNV